MGVRPPLPHMAAIYNVLKSEHVFHKYYFVTDLEKGVVEQPCWKIIIQQQNIQKRRMVSSKLRLETYFCVTLSGNNFQYPLGCNG